MKRMINKYIPSNSLTLVFVFSLLISLLTNCNRENQDQAAVVARSNDSGESTEELKKQIEEIKQEVETLKVAEQKQEDEVTQAKKIANEAEQKAISAQSESDEIKHNLESTKKDLKETAKKAVEADKTAKKAHETAKEAHQTAEKAKDKSITSLANATVAHKKATNAQDAAIKSEAKHKQEVAKQKKKAEKEPKVTGPKSVTIENHHIHKKCSTDELKLSFQPVVTFSTIDAHKKVGNALVKSNSSESHKIKDFLKLEFSLTLTNLNKDEVPGDCIPHIKIKSLELKNPKDENISIKYAKNNTKLEPNSKVIIHVGANMEKPKDLEKKEYSPRETHKINNQTEVVMLPSKSTDQMYHSSVLTVKKEGGNSPQRYAFQLRIKKSDLYNTLKELAEQPGNEKAKEFLDKVDSNNNVVEHISDSANKDLLDMIIDAYFKNVTLHITFEIDGHVKTGTATITGAVGNKLIVGLVDFK